MKKRATSLLLIFSFLFAFAPLCAMGVAAADSWQPVFRYLHISDEHITASTPTGTPTSTGTQISGVVRAAKAIADRDGVPISAVTAGGDQISAAYPNEYEALVARFGEIHDLMGEEFPILAVLGNHDYNNGYWSVNFPQCGEKDDIATLAVHEDDMEVVPVMYAIENERIKAEWDKKGKK